MHQGLTVQHSLNVSRNIIRQVLKILDTEEVNARLKQRLKQEYTLQKARIICGIWTATINLNLLVSASTVDRRL